MEHLNVFNVNNNNKINNLNLLIVELLYLDLNKNWLITIIDQSEK
jgi:hypothetical protein